MKKGTVKLKENMAPTDEDKPVDPKVKASLEAISWTADKGVKVSGYLGTSGLQQGECNVGGIVASQKRNTIHNTSFSITVQRV